MVCLVDLWSPWLYELGSAASSPRSQEATESRTWALFASVMELLVSSFELVRSPGKVWPCTLVSMCKDCDSFMSMCKDVHFECCSPSLSSCLSALHSLLFQGSVLLAPSHFIVFLFLFYICFLSFIFLVFCFHYYCVDQAIRALIKAKALHTVFSLVTRYMSWLTFNIPFSLSRNTH